MAVPTDRPTGRRDPPRRRGPASDVAGPTTAAGPDGAATASDPTDPATAAGPTDAATGLQAGPPVTAVAVPYYAWANRGPAPMRVWLPLAR